MQNGLTKVLVRVAKFLAENERLLVVAASTMIMSLSHTALRPVLPTFAKVRKKTPRREAFREAPARFWKLLIAPHTVRHSLVVSRLANECTTPSPAMRPR